MMHDFDRNDKYELAIRHAIKSAGRSHHKNITVMDIGAGAGLLSLMAARAGAARVIAVEQSSHLAEGTYIYSSLCKFYF